MQKHKIFIIFLAIALLGLLGLANLPKVYSQHQSEIDKGVSYIKAQPQEAWATMVLAAAGEQDIDLSHLQSVPENQKSATTYAKYILALVAMGENPTSFGNEDYVAALKTYFQDNQFGAKALLNDDVWAILALGSIGQENLAIAQSAKDYILQYQNQNGGWGYATSADSDTNSTASTITALIEAGVSPQSSEILQAVDYLQSSQNDDGGFPYSPGFTSDSCSDAWVISAIERLGQSPTSSDWLKNNNSALDSLLSLQDQDGAFWWQGEDDNKFCSPYAVLALLGQHYPLQTDYNLHHLQIEGASGTLCDSQVHGGTAMDLVISGSVICSYDYVIEEYPGLGLYLAEIAGESGWLYKVNGILPEVGAADYYLTEGDEVLWYLAEMPEEQSDASQTVGLKVEIEGAGEPGPGEGGQPSISFEVSPALLDFGKLKAGESALRDVGLSNGDSAIYLETEVVGDDIFKHNLEIEQTFWQFFSTEIEANQEEVFEVKLTVPSSYSESLGIKQGELTFWAMKK